MEKRDWETLEAMLIKLADMQAATWQEKREAAERNLSPSGLAALNEISAWFE